MPRGAGQCRAPWGGIIVVVVLLALAIDRDQGLLVSIEHAVDLDRVAGLDLGEPAGNRGGHGAGHACDRDRAGADRGDRCLSPGRAEPARLARVSNDRAASSARLRPVGTADRVPFVKPPRRAEGRRAVGERAAPWILHRPEASPLYLRVRVDSVEASGRTRDSTRLSIREHARYDAAVPSRLDQALDAQPHRAVQGCRASSLTVPRCTRALGWTKVPSASADARARWRRSPRRLVP